MSLFQSHTIQGDQDGPHLLITAGVHGDEYEGMVAIRQLLTTVDPAGLRGRLTLVPVVNQSAFALHSRCGSDGLDLARTCPGDPEGTLTERVAHDLSALINTADYFIDLHTGGGIMQVDPLAGYGLVPDPSVLDLQRQMARAFGLPVIWGTSGDLPGRSLSVARDAGVPAIYTEYLGGGGCSPEGVSAYHEGCRNVMASLGMIDPRPEPAAPEVEVEDPRPASGHMQICHPSPATGYFEPAVTLGQTVTAGQSLGRILDPLGSSPLDVPADHPGRVLTLRTCPSVMEGDSLAVILENPR